MNWLQEDIMITEKIYIYYQNTIDFVYVLYLMYDFFVMSRTNVGLLKSSKHKVGRNHESTNRKEKTVDSEDNAA